MRNISRFLGLAVGLSLISSIAGSATRRHESQAGTPVRTIRGFRITSVEGPSWLKHLGIPFELSNMGRVGRWGPAPTPPANGPWSGKEGEGNFVLSGADLYRLSCESCHEPAGTGVPPEINSLIGPVQATSPVLIRQQMKQRGIDIGTKMVRDLSSQAEAAIRARLTNGGTKMPPFRHLQRAELDSVFAYLNLLAGVPGAEGKQIRVRESAMRVGELLVKGTCHICHDATGPGSGGGGKVAQPGVIPSLASLPKERAEFEVVRKVREGLPMPMPMMTSSRGEMPLFPRLTPEEISAAFEYLASFPPRP